MTAESSRPNTAMVREKYATVLDKVAGWKWSEEWAADFDRWLADHDRQVRKDERDRAPLADLKAAWKVAAERERERDEARAERDELVQRLAALCDDDWLRRRDRCMGLPGSSNRHSRTPASAWEEAATHVRSVLNELVGYEDEYDARHTSYLAWLNGGRDAGEAARAEADNRMGRGLHLEGGGES